MENKLTELVFILDKSGSMQGCEKSVVDGFNDLIKKQKAEALGLTKVTVILFDNSLEILMNRLDLGVIAELTTRDYVPNGGTALYDAIGMTSAKLSKIINNSKPEDKPTKVMIFIYTDGFENASKEYNGDAIKDIITLKESQGWEYYFIGAEKESVTMAKTFGIKDSRSSLNVYKDEEAMMGQFNSLSKVISNKRKLVHDNIQSDIEEKKAEENWDSEIKQSNNRK